MSTFTLVISCLITSNLTWFMDLTFHVPMQYCSLQHRILVLSPVPFTTEWWNVPLVSLIFLKTSLVFPILLFSSISLHWSLKRLSYLFLLFFGTLHSDAYIFPFLLCFSLLLFSQLFVRPPQTAILLFCISFPWGCSWSLSPVQCHEPPSIVHQALYQI